MSRFEQAIKKFKGGYNCAQCILCSYSEELGLSEDVALKLTTGLGSSARHGGVCGTVAGAIMVIGLKYGCGDERNYDKKMLTYDLVEEYKKKFMERNGSIICKDLLEYDISKEEDIRFIQEKNSFNTICSDVIESAIEILEEIL